MFRISKDSPVYYLTSVTNSRLPAFQKAKLKNIACNALNEARTSSGLLVFAYVIMPDHLHALIGSQRKPSEVLRYVNGISAHRVINFLKETGFDSSLQKLKRENGNRQYKYSLCHSGRGCMSYHCSHCKRFSHTRSADKQVLLSRFGCEKVYREFRLMRQATLV